MGGKYRVTNNEKKKMTVKLQWLEAVRKLLLSLAVIGRDKRGCHEEKKTQLGFFFWSRNGGWRLDGGSTKEKGY
jgi:hypothetical protein